MNHDGEKWLLLRIYDPSLVFMEGPYTVILNTEGNLWGKWEVIEEGKDASANEWLRLINLKYGLVQVYECMDS